MYVDSYQPNLAQQTVTRIRYSDKYHRSHACSAHELEQRALAGVLLGFALGAAAAVAVSAVTGSIKFGVSFAALFTAGETS